MSLRYNMSLTCIQLASAKSAKIPETIQQSKRSCYEGLDFILYFLLTQAFQR